jgi:hypothetical protein
VICATIPYWFVKKKPSRVYIRFFIYDWTLIDMNLIHSYCIHNHIPIRIAIIIHNSIHVAKTKSWLNHPFYHDIMKNIWFFVCIPTHVFFHESFSVKNTSLQYLDRETFIFTPLAWTSNTLFINISRIRSCIINKILNLITIIHLPQPLGWISIHSWTIIYYLYKTYIK